MKKNIEITGEIIYATESTVRIRLHICGDITDFFAVDTEEKELQSLFTWIFYLFSLFARYLDS